VTYLKPLSSVVSSVALVVYSAAPQASFDSFRANTMAADLGLSAPQLKILTNEQLLALANDSIAINRIDPRALNNQVWVHQHLNLPGGKQKTKAAVTMLKHQILGSDLSFRANNHTKTKAKNNLLNYGVGLSSGKLKLKVNYRF